MRRKLFAFSAGQKHMTFGPDVLWCPSRAGGIFCCSCLEDCNSLLRAGEILCESTAPPRSGAGDIIHRMGYDPRITPPALQGQGHRLGRVDGAGEWIKSIRLNYVTTTPSTAWWRLRWYSLSARTLVLRLQGSHSLSNSSLYPTEAKIVKILWLLETTPSRSGSIHTDWAIVYLILDWLRWKQYQCHFVCLTSLSVTWKSPGRVFAPKSLPYLDLEFLMELPSQLQTWRGTEHSKAHRVWGKGSSDCC